MATDRLERGAGPVGLDLVIARGDPDPPRVFEPHLGRAEHMPGRMERDRDAVDVERLAVGTSRSSRGSPPSPGDARPPGDEVLARIPREVVGVRVRDDGAIDGPPGVDEKPPRSQ